MIEFLGKDEFLNFVLSDTELFNIDTVFENFGDVANLVFIEVENLDGQDPLKSFKAHQILVVYTLIVKLNALSEEEKIWNSFEILLDPAVVFAASNAMVKVDNKVKGSKLIINDVIFLFVGASGDKFFICLDHLIFVLAFKKIDSLFEDRRRHVVRQVFSDI
jgi:hypothetical protein